MESLAGSGSTFAVPNDSVVRRPTNLAAITFTAPGTSAVYRLSFSLDVQTTSNGALLIAYFTVDGTVLTSPQAVIQSVGGQIRSPLAKEMRLTGLSAGSHTVEVRVTTLTNGTATILSHSTLHLQQIT